MDNVDKYSFQAVDIVEIPFHMRRDFFIFGQNLFSTRRIFCNRGEYIFGDGYTKRKTCFWRGKSCLIGSVNAAI